MGLDGTCALVTGGSRGIGLASARALRAEGVRVALLGRDASTLDAAAASVRAGTVTEVAGTCDDLAVRRAVERAASTLGRLDIVVSCAAPRATPGQTPGWPGWTTRTSCARSTRRCSATPGSSVQPCRTWRRRSRSSGRPGRWRAALPHLEATRGRVVNISGMNARWTGSLIGSVRNLGVVALTKSLADELGPRGVTVTCVHPGLTVTERTEDDAGVRRDRVGQRRGPADRGRRDRRRRDLPRLPCAALLNGAVIEADGGRPGPISA